MSRRLHQLVVTLVLVATVAVVGGAASGGATAATATATEFSGQATIVKGTLLGQPLTPIVDTTPLDPAGGEKHACFFEYPDTPGDCTVDGLPVGDPTNGALSATLLRADTVGRGSRSDSEASTAEFRLDVGRLLGLDAPLVLTGGALTATASAACRAGVAAVSGSSDVLDLLVNGTPVDPIVDPLTGQRAIVVGPVTIYLNEVTATSSGNTGAVDVNAIRIHLDDNSATPLVDERTDLVIGYVHADIKCAQPRPACAKEKMTGGGWYTWLGDRAHFAFAAGHRPDGQAWGHLMYQHRALGVKVKGRPDVVQFAGIDYVGDDGAVVASGPAEGTAGGRAVGRFTVVAIDNGEPGRRDHFAIVLLSVDGDEVYRSNIDASTSLLGGGLDGGNVQYHGCKQVTAKR